MTTGVGLTVGDSVSTAVVTASGTDVRTIEHPSVLFTAPDGTVQLGDPARNRPAPSATSSPASASPRASSTRVR